ncbi:MAG TPA: aminotransferase class I/II-fold pyridoxal phosphate-dependent enzyme, partial [Candidatus Acidoferrales bacterium]|nr:aminotransferase class I/II-fold pyridoxal phosphate-dependent enzyme [Candidatus Acidoferrales bacterium]
RTIVLDGFSKTFAMTGWRLGYGAFPKPLVEPVAKLVTNSVSCTATFTQRAGIVAMDQRPPEVPEMVKQFRARRDAIVAGLNRVDGITCRTPQGAFYVFPNITRLGLGNAATVASRVLQEAGVACLAGTAFGPVGEGHLRISYANSLENLELAVERIGAWVRSARPAPVH